MAGRRQTGETMRAVTSAGPASGAVEGASEVAFQSGVGSTVRRARSEPSGERLESDMHRTGST